MVKRSLIWHACEAEGKDLLSAKGAAVEARRQL